MVFVLSVIIALRWIYGRNGTPRAEPDPHALPIIVTSNKPIKVRYNNIIVPKNNIVFNPDKTPMMLGDIRTITVRTVDYPAEVTLSLPYDKVEKRRELAGPVVASLPFSDPFIIHKPYYYTFKISTPEVIQV